MQGILEFVAKRLPERVISVDGDVYLRRYYVCGRLTTSKMPAARERLRWLPTVYLHKFTRPDRDRALHNHPWKWACSVILSGSYDEEFMRFGKIRTRRVRLVNYIRHSTFHRISNIHGCMWSLFIAGEKVSSWGFKDRDTGEFTHWDSYIE